MKKDKITITIEEYKKYLKATEQLNMIKSLLLGSKKNSYYDLKEMAIAVFGVSVGDSDE